MHVRVEKPVKYRIDETVHTRPRAQPGKVDRFVHRVSDRMFDRSLCFGHFIHPLKPLGDKPRRLCGIQMAAALTLIRSALREPRPVRAVRGK
jgi:hypothetical protein